MMSLLRGVRTTYRAHKLAAILAVFVGLIVVAAALVPRHAGHAATLSVEGLALLVVIVGSTVVVHEWAHVSVARRVVGVPVRFRIVRTAAGFAVFVPDGMSPRQTIRVFLAGPAAGIVTSVSIGAAIFVAVVTRSGQLGLLGLVAEMAAATALISHFACLIPVSEFDGAKILRARRELRAISPPPPHRRPALTIIVATVTALALGGGVPLVMHQGEGAVVVPTVRPVLCPPGAPTHAVSVSCIPAGSGTASAHGLRTIWGTAQTAHKWVLLPNITSPGGLIQFTVLSTTGHPLSAGLYVARGSKTAVGTSIALSAPSQAGQAVGFTIISTQPIGTVHWLVEESDVPLPQTLWSGPITYGGGPIVARPVVDLVLVGSWVPAQLAAYTTWIRALGLSSWWGLLGEYKVGALTVGSARIVPTPPPNWEAALTTSETNWPSIPVPAGDNLQLQIWDASSAATTQFGGLLSTCGVHGKMPSGAGGKQIPVAVFPAPSEGDCIGAGVNDTFASVTIAHELAEMVTDPGTGAKRSWATGGTEVADECGSQPLALVAGEPVPALWAAAGDAAGGTCVQIPSQPTDPNKGVSSK